VSVSAQAGDHYLVVDLNRGSQTRIPAEPLLSPDGTRFVVPDFCDTQCGNAMELWRFDRDRLVRMVDLHTLEEVVDVVTQGADLSGGGRIVGEEVIRDRSRADLERAH
jgi:hypothetical protein